MNEKPLASWYTPGLSDGLGDRLLMFDNSDAPSLELLRFHPHLAQAPGFEAALREEVERLARFQHPAFARVRSVQRLEPDDDLALVSNYTPGKRLSEVLHRTQGPAFAAALIRQLAPALALFQQHAAGASHGVLDPDRIVVSPDGRLTIVEHVVGRAIDTLDASQLASMGIAAPSGEDGPRRLDAAADWYQLGLVALSVLIGRPVTPQDLPEIETLLDEVDASGGPDGTRLSPFIRQWLARVLQISGESIESAEEARAALDELLYQEGSGDPRRIEAPHAGQVPAVSSTPLPREHRAVEQAPAAVRGTAASAPEPINTGGPASMRRPAAAAASPPALAARQQPSVAPRRAAVEHERPPQPAPPDPLSMFERETLAARTSLLEFKSVPAVHQAPATRTGQSESDRRTFSVSVVAALALVAVAQAGVIAWMAHAAWLAPRPVIASETTAAGESLRVNGAAPLPAALHLTVAPDLSWAGVSSPPADGTTGAKAADNRTATVRILTPMDLKVFEGDRQLGSVPGNDIRLPAGRHEIALVNSALGYRLVQNVDLEAGRTWSLYIAPPQGSVTIDASPWAEVTIDGRPAGRTPLGPLPLTVGEHEITFRHPAGSDDRQRVVVKAEGLTRVVGKLRF